MVSPTKNVHYTKYFRGRLETKKAVKKPPLCSPREHSMIYNALILKHALKNEQQISKQLFLITTL